MSILPKGKFNPKNVHRNLAKDGKIKAPKKKQCMHFWVVKKTMVKRNGIGEAMKIKTEKCAMCDKVKKSTEKYVDTRVMYEANKNE